MFTFHTDFSLCDSGYYAIHYSILRGQCYMTLFAINNIIKSVQCLYSTKSISPSLTQHDESAKCCNEQRRSKVATIKAARDRPQFRQICNLYNINFGML